MKQKAAPRGNTASPPEIPKHLMPSRRRETSTRRRRGRHNNTFETAAIVHTTKNNKILLHAIRVRHRKTSR